MVAKCGSNVSGFIPTGTHGVFRKYAISSSHPAYSSRACPKVLPGGYHVEAWEASKYHPFLGCYRHTPSVRFGVDIEWEYNGIH